MKESKIVNYVLGLMLFIILGSIVFLLIQKNKFKLTGRLVNVKIVNRLPSGKGMNNAVYECEFYIDGELKRNTSTTELEKNKDFYVGNFYPALYLEKTNGLKILITPEDFEDNNLKYPDSLLRRSN